MVNLHGCKHNVQNIPWLFFLECNVAGTIEIDLSTHSRQSITRCVYIICVTHPPINPFIYVRHVYLHIVCIHAFGMSYCAITKTARNLKTASYKRVFWDYVYTLNLLHHPLPPVPPPPILTDRSSVTRSSRSPADSFETPAHPCEQQHLGSLQDTWRNDRSHVHFQAPAPILKRVAVP